MIFMHFFWKIGFFKTIMPTNPGKHFQTKNSKGFGVDALNYGLVASGAILHYLEKHNITNYNTLPL